MSRLNACLVLLPLLAGAFAGCVQGPTATEDVDPQSLLGLLPSTEPLWNNPQTTPHPLFNYPTLTNPATGEGVPAWWQPITARPLPATIAGLEVVKETKDIVPAGAGMSVFGGLAVVPGYGQPTSIVDIRDPAAPVLLSTIEGEAHRNVDFIAYPTGRLVAVFSTGEGILPIWDITDPAAPKRLGEMKPATGTHKVNVVPGTPIVYNANSRGGSGGLGPGLLDGHRAESGQGLTEIYDLTDPESPILVQDWKNGYGCHHIYFWHSAEKQRALCAGIEFTQIWDTADPRNPAVIVSVPVHHGRAGLPSTAEAMLAGAAFSHFSILNDDGTILIVGDEMGGGGLPPGCGVHAATPARDVSTPLGALWFYDVTDETDPQLLGWFSPGQHFTKHREAGSCTAHHGRLVPDPEGRDLLAMAFYGAGVGLIDFSNPMSPRLVDQFNEGTDTWEVQYYNGYLFTGDLARGMDVLTFK